MVKPYEDPRLAVNLAGIPMKTPVTTASGTFGFGLEFTDFLDLDHIGAITVKGTTLKPRPGNKGQRLVETPAGVLNCVGLENPGVEFFLKETLPHLRKVTRTPVIVNIDGDSAEEYGKLAELLDVDGVDAIELNISCPNVAQGGLAFGTDCYEAGKVVQAARAHTHKPVITKLSPNVTDITEIARAVEAAGTDAISLINTLVGMKIDIQKRRPVLGNVVGGLSGPAVRPVAVRMVYQVAQAVKVPLVGMGGISCWQDAIEFILAGATAVAVGTCNFTRPDLAEQISFGIQQYLDENGVKSLDELRGQALPRKV
jgi:dihydroorotate dehydrogenase (NAD+) catalytic subunit